MAKICEAEDFELEEYKFTPKVYEKNGFTAEKEEKFSLLRLQGEGYPIKMKKTY